jgi:hypothetical protein
MTATDTFHLLELQDQPMPTAAAAPGATTAATLRTAHLAAGPQVASLDLDDATLWRRVDGIVAAISAQAYAVAAALSGQPKLRCATRVAPVVRVRELAAAQSALFAQLA